MLTRMPRWTATIGVILIVLGVAAYIGTGMESWTALLPSALGLILFMAGWMAMRSERLRKPALWLAGGVALLGALGSLRGLGDLFALVAGGSVERPTAAAAQGITLLLCLILLGVAGKHFLRADSTSSSE